MIGVGHYDPYLGDAVHGPAGQAFAQASLGVIVRLNDVLRAAYTQAGMPMANVGAAFELRDRARSTCRDWGQCPLTWHASAH